MKTQSLLRKGLVAMLAVFLSVGLQSCLDDDDDTLYFSNYYANALVTVKLNADNAPYLQLDDSTTLRPVNMSRSPFGEKEVRALANIATSDEDPQGYSRAVFVNWIDSLLTKPMALNLGEEENDRTYGNDPVEIFNDWVTIAEDGYLTLRFATRWGTERHISSTWFRRTIRRIRTRWSSVTMRTVIRMDGWTMRWLPSSLTGCPIHKARR